jgi:hypothetical protein
VRELRDPDKIIERLDQIKRGDSGDTQKDWAQAKDELLNPFFHPFL